MPWRAADSPASRFVLGGLLASVLAVAGNLAWREAFPHVSGHALPSALTVPSVALATVLSVWLAAGIYLMLARALAIATPLYVVGCLLVAGVSSIAPFTPFMPDGSPAPEGFPLAAIPMHVIAGVIAAVVVPLVVVIGKRPTAEPAATHPTSPE